MAPCWVYAIKDIGKFGGERPAKWFSLDRGIRRFEDWAVSAKALGSKSFGGFEGQERLRCGLCRIEGRIGCICHCSLHMNSRSQQGWELPERQGYSGKP